MTAISSIESRRSSWQTVALLTLGFWLSASLILDWVIMPSLYISGMMTQASFATTGYVIFWNFNRIELLSAGLVLTSVLALSQTLPNWQRGSLILSTLLLAISLIETYFLVPQMSAMGMQLNLFQPLTELPTGMSLFHGSYWLLEVVKLVTGGALLRCCLK